MLEQSEWIFLITGLIAGLITGAFARHFFDKIPLFLSTSRLIAKAQIKAVVHSNNNGFVVIDNQNQIIYANQAILAIFGYQLHELKNLSLTRLIPDAKYTNIETEQQTTAHKKDGTTIHISLLINKTMAFNTTLTSAFIRDDTVEVETRQQLKYHRNKFETLFNSCTDGIIYVNEAFEVNDANEHFLSLYGDSLDKVINQDVRNLYHTNTTELNHIKKLLKNMGEAWDLGNTLARLNSRQQRQITVMISKQQAAEFDANRVIYVFRDISKELELIGHIAQKNRTQELSEAMVKMGYWRYDAKKTQLWCSNQVFQILRLPNNQQNIVDIDTLYKLVDSDEQQTIVDAIYASFTHLMPLSLSLAIKTHDNEIKQVVLKGICEASLGEVCAFYGVFQDVSEQLAQEENLRLTKERLEQSQLFSNIGNWQWDIGGGQMFWSELTSPMFGDIAQNLTRDFEHFITLIHPDDKSAVVQAINRCTERAEKYDIEHRVIWPDNSIHWLHQQGDVIRDAQGVAVSMLGVVQDITERKNKETELQLFKQIIESSNQAIMVSDEQGHLIYTNPAHQQKFLHQQDVSQHHFRDFLTQGFEASEIHQLIEQSITQKGYWSGELQSKRTDNTTFPAHVSLTQYDDKANNTKYRFSICYDVSEDILQKQKLNQAKLNAESANRAKSEFLSSMSHELRTPLNAVLGFSQLLLRQKDVPFSTRITSNIEAIYKAGEHLLTLINGILDLAKIESGHKAPEFEAVNIKDMINEAVRLITPQAEEKGLSLKTPDGSKIPVLYSQRKIPIVNGDFTMLKQAMLNYLSNAVKYNKENGMIFITVDVFETNQTTRITVSDNGIGIAAQSICELFIPFNRLGMETSNIQGTGIGLAITKKNIEGHQGIVGVKSKPGAGSSFWIELPYIQLVDIDKPRCDKLTQSLKKSGTTNTVLYVEDNVSNIELMQSYFEDIAQARLICADNAELGIAYATEYQPQIIMMDLNLPGMDGYTALRTLRDEKKFDNTIVIAVTADVMNETQEKVKQAGFDAFLSKPISFDTLQQLLSKYKLTASG